MFEITAAAATAATATAAATAAVYTMAVIPFPLLPAKCFYTIKPSGYFVYRQMAQLACVHQNSYRDLVVKPQGKCPPGSSKRKKDDYIKMDLEAKGWKVAYFIASDQNRERKRVLWTR